MSINRTQRCLGLPTIALLVASCVLVSPQSFGQEKAYRILVTNDDGVDSDGIEALARELEKNAEILVVAPEEDVSGSGMATKALRGKAYVREHRKGDRLFGYSVTATPVDAVRFGIMELGKDKKFDLVVSGVNRGANVGDVSHYSGTVGAAMQAVSHGLPAIAVSQSHRDKDYTRAARFTAKIVDQVRKRGLRPGVMLSINVPSGEIAGVVAAPMGGNYLSIDSFEKRVDNAGKSYYKSKLRLLDVKGKDAETLVYEPPGTDTRFYQKKYITITPLKFDWTAHETLNALKAWDLDLE